MIAKQVKGKSFRGCLNYLQGKQDSQIIGGNMAGKTARQLASEFKLSRSLNPNVERVVYHASLSVPASEKLSDEQWTAIANTYLNSMGFNDNQYVLIKHNDTDHNHVHIVASRIRFDGSCVSDSWDYKRSENIVRQLEKDFKLQSGQKQHPEKKSPTTGEIRLSKRTGELSIREQIQSAIDRVSKHQPTIVQLIEELKEQNINTQIHFTRNGLIKGISYELEQIAFSGTNLGSAYTFPGLQKYRNVSYQADRDNVWLLDLQKTQKKTITQLKSTNLELE
jgi:hypothetical protein